MPGVVLDGYLAFREPAAIKVMEIHKLKRTMFGVPFQYIPFTDTVTDSVLKAVTGKPGVAVPEVAEETSAWHVLKITMSAVQVAEAFKAGLLAKISGINQWH